MMFSWRYLDWEEERMRCKMSRTLLSVARMCRRMEASSGLAESASSPAVCSVNFRRLRSSPSSSDCSGCMAAVNARRSSG